LHHALENIIIGLSSPPSDCAGSLGRTDTVYRTSFSRLCQAPVAFLLAPHAPAYCKMDRVCAGCQFHGVSLDRFDVPIGNLVFGAEGFSYWVLLPSKNATGPLS
jgi:hypothetical protein